MIIKRQLTKLIKTALKTFPAVIITGPRQAGKTTMLQHEFGKKFRYLNLEDLDVRKRAVSDPRAFLEGIKPAILDEIQRVPELLNYIKTMIDEHREINGRWIITGSQQFELMKGVTESLAGRVAILGLLPLSYGETTNTKPGWLNKSLAEIILRGSYPELVTETGLSRDLWSGSYINSYIERDVRSLRQVGDLRQFELFVTSCATRTGTILDLSSIARDIGVSVPTAKAWLSVLVAGNQVYLLSAYYRNLGKRLIKSPKIYFIDTGLASYLMGISDSKMLISNPYYGQLVETFIVTEKLKTLRHKGLRESIYYLRTRDGLEVDLVHEKGDRLDLLEIKSGKTIAPDAARQLRRLRNDISEAWRGESVVVYGGEESASLGEKIKLIGWREWAQSL